MEKQPGPGPVVTVDCHYLKPEHAASYLLIERNKALFIDNNTVHAVPFLIRALEEHRLRPDQVAYIIPTHVHLDHAGGTSALVEQCSNAQVLAHPRAVRHLVDPSRLIEGVKAVYGEEIFNERYAPINPIDAGRVRGVEDGETLRFGERTLSFMHTRGHANHHICIHDSASNGVFSGDTFGIEYKMTRKSKRPFLMCSTAPADFDPEQARLSVKRIVDTGAERVYVAHYGEVTDVKEASKVLLEAIDQMDAILKEAAASDLPWDQLVEFCDKRVRAACKVHALACGAEIDDREWFEMDDHLRINAQGLALVAQKKAAGM